MGMSKTSVIKWFCSLATKIVNLGWVTKMRISYFIFSITFNTPSILCDTFIWISFSNFVSPVSPGQCHSTEEMRAFFKTEHYYLSMFDFFKLTSPPINLKARIWKKKRLKYENSISRYWLKFLFIVVGWYGCEIQLLESINTSIFVYSIDYYPMSCMCRKVNIHIVMNL